MSDRPHGDHNVVTVNEHVVFDLDGEYSQVHDGILYCKDCEEEFVPDTEDGY